MPRLPRFCGINRRGQKHAWLAGSIPLRIQSANLNSICGSARDWNFWASLTKTWLKARPWREQPQTAWISRAELLREVIPLIAGRRSLFLGQTKNLANGRTGLLNLSLG